MNDKEFTEQLTTRTSDVACDLKPANRYQEDSSYIVPAAGNIKELYFSPHVHHCGRIKNGVAFEFDDEGSWVIDLDTLRRIVEMAEAARATDGTQ